MDDIVEIRITQHDPATGELPLWPDTVDAFYADAACTIRSDLTRKNWGYTYRRLQSHHPDTPLAGFSTDDLVAYITQRGVGGPKWAPMSARNYRIALSSVFGWAHLAGRIPTDPAASLGRLIRIRHHRVRAPHWLTDTQIAALVATTDTDHLGDRRDRIVFHLGLLAGLRTAELCALTWANVDLAAGTLRFTGKGDKPAHIVIADQLAAELHRWADTLRANGIQPHGDVPVACRTRTSPAGTTVVATPLSWNALAMIVHARGKRIGIADLRPHDMRRTLAGLLDDQGVRLQDIRHVLRHERLATTEAYLADNPRRVATRMRALTLPR